MWNDTDKRAIPVRIWNTDHKRRANLLGNAESTCQTSPRSGSTLRVLLSVERTKHVGGEGREVVVGKIVRHRNPFDDSTPELDAFWRRELLDIGKNVGNGLSHGQTISGSGPQRKRSKCSTDSKLSDGGIWRDGCASEGGGAASVNVMSIRCRG